MADQDHHHHHHGKHKRDSASIFKEKSLRAIQTRKKIEKYIKIALLVVAIMMGLAVVFVYKFG